MTVNVHFKELKELISQGEGYNLEFKESFNDSLGKEICAMANANGGKILLGVSDTGEIKGVNITNRLKSQVQDIVRNFDPSFQVSCKGIENILVVEVPEGVNKPYAAAGKYFLRNGPNSQQLKRDEIRQFFEKEGLILFDEKINNNFDMRRDFSVANYNRFVKLAGIPKYVERERLLMNLELFEGKLLKNAGVLLFCKKITKHVRQATIRCSVFQGKDKYKIIDVKEFSADFYTNYVDTINHLKSKLNTEYIIKGGPRDEILELPEDALREALLNAMSHRNYFFSGSIHIHIFADRVEFINPGGLVPGMTVGDLGRKSMPRNILLFGLLQRMDLAEHVGSGLLRINQAMDDYKLSRPVIEAGGDWFTVTFMRPDLQERTFEQRMKPDKLPRGKIRDTLRDTLKDTLKLLSVKEKLVLQSIGQNPRITAQDLSKILQINLRNTKRYLAMLQEKGVIERIGPAKGGHWEVRE